MSKVMILILAAGLILGGSLIALASDQPMPEGCQKVEGDDNSCTKPGDGRPVWYRFFIGTEGMGIVKCAGCSTAAGCTALWCGGSVTCKATPAPGWKFEYWSANGNFAGDKDTIGFCRRGATLKGHFAAQSQ